MKLFLYLVPLMILSGCGKDSDSQTTTNPADTIQNQVTVDRRIAGLVIKNSLQGVAGFVAVVSKISLESKLSLDAIANQIDQQVELICNGPDGCQFKKRSVK